MPFKALLHRQNRLTTGWALSGITRFSSGLPVTLYNNNDTSLMGTIPNGINSDGVDTPDYRPGNLAVNTDPRNGKSAFNTSLFGRRTENLIENILDINEMGVSESTYYNFGKRSSIGINVFGSLNLGDKISLRG